MKLAVGFLILLFTSFFVTPIIMSLIDNGNELSVIITAADEELDEFFKFNLKADPVLFFFVSFPKSSEIIFFKNILKHSFLSYSIFIPPPELD